MSGVITRRGNRIKALGAFGMADIHNFRSILYDATFKKGYQDVVFDFTEMDTVFSGFMMSLCSKVIAMKKEGYSFKILSPKNKKMKDLFSNTNWGNIIDSTTFKESRYRGRKHVPVIQFNSHSEQNKAVNKILDAMLCSLSEITRKDLAAIEWALNEITDNVLVHSESETGGLIQLSAFNTNQKRIEFSVVDGGIGIPASLKPALKANSDIDVLRQSINEGVTNGKGIGNGLYGSFRTCTESGGYFHIHSGNASLIFIPKTGRKESILKVKNEKIPFNGTLLVGCLDYSVSGLLENALKFKGFDFDNPDFFELIYQDDYLTNSCSFKLSEESDAFGTRIAGAATRRKLENLISFLEEDSQIIVDFEGSPLLSSSFADEVFGKLMVDLGEGEFSSLVRFVNLEEDDNKVIIERALNQRKTSKKAGTSSA